MKTQTALPTVHVWSHEEIRTNVDQQDKWLYRGLLALYSKQTANEQVSKSTTESNRMGFSAFDAEFLTSLTNQLMATKSLSVNQKKAARRAMHKYAKQLARIANKQD